MRNDAEGSTATTVWAGTGDVMRRKAEDDKTRNVDDSRVPSPSLGWLQHQINSRADQFMPQLVGDFDAELRKILDQGEH